MGKRWKASSQGPRLNPGPVMMVENNLDQAKHYAWDDAKKDYYDKAREKLDIGETD